MRLRAIGAEIGRPSSAAAATRSPSGLRFWPCAAGQYSPFCLPGSLFNFVACTPAGLPSCPCLRVATLRGDVGTGSRDRLQSLAPIRRASTSSLPAAVSNRHPSAPLTSGTGKGHSSLPMTSVFFAGVTSSRRHCSLNATANTRRFIRPVADRMTRSAPALRDRRLPSAHRGSRS